MFPETRGHSLETVQTVIAMPMQQAVSAASGGGWQAFGLQQEIELTQLGAVYFNRLARAGKQFVDGC